MLDLQKEFKKIENVNLFGDIIKPKHFFNTGNAALNYILSGSIRGGFPTSRIVEIFGPESNGKSTVLYSAISQAQKQGFFTYLIDTEGAFDQSQVERCGIDTSKLIYSEPKNAVSMFTTMYQVIKTLYEDNKNTLPLLIGWDSVAASSLLADEKSFDNNSAASLARAISPGINKINPMIVKHPVCLVCVNQTRWNIGGWKPVEDTPGGKTLKFYASIRMRISRKANWENKNKETIGLIAECTTVKNKIFRPFLKTPVCISYAHGLDFAYSLIDLATSVDVFKMGGGWLKYGEIAKRKQEWVDLVTTDESFKSKIEDEVEIALQTNGVIEQAEPESEEVDE